MEGKRASNGSNTSDMSRSCILYGRHRLGGSDCVSPCMTQDSPRELSELSRAFVVAICGEIMIMPGPAESAGSGFDRCRLRPENRRVVLAVQHNSPRAGRLTLPRADTVHIRLWAVSLPGYVACVASMNFHSAQLPMRAAF